MIPQLKELSQYVGLGVAIMSGDCAKKCKVLSLDACVDAHGTTIKAFHLRDKNGCGYVVLPDNCFRNRREAIEAAKKEELEYIDSRIDASLTGISSLKRTIAREQSELDELYARKKALMEKNGIVEQKGE